MHFLHKSYHITILCASFLSILLLLQKYVVIELGIYIIWHEELKNFYAFSSLSVLVKNCLNYVTRAFYLIKYTFVSDSINNQHLSSLTLFSVHPRILLTRQPAYRAKHVVLSSTMRISFTENLDLLFLDCLTSIRVHKSPAIALSHSYITQDLFCFF